MKSAGEILRRVVQLLLAFMQDRHPGLACDESAAAVEALVEAERGAVASDPRRLALAAKGRKLRMAEREAVRREKDETDDPDTESAALRARRAEYEKEVAAYERADALMVSDFEMGALPAAVKSGIKARRKAGNRFFAVSTEPRGSAFRRLRAAELFDAAWTYDAYARSIHAMRGNNSIRGQDARAPRLRGLAARAPATEI